MGRAWFILAASARRCAQRMECNGGFGFQTKMKDRFLTREGQHVGILVGKKHASPVATASLVLLFFLFSF